MIATGGLRTRLLKSLTLLCLLFATESAQSRSLAEIVAELSAPSGARERTALILSAVKAGRRIVAVGEHGIVLYSDDSGENWQQSMVPIDVTLTSVIFVSSMQGWACGHNALIMHTRDGGQTWIVQNSGKELGAPLLKIWFDTPLHGLALGAQGNLFKTENGGTTWSHQIVETQDGEHFDAHLFDLVRTGTGSYLLAAEQGIIYRSRDGTQSWEQIKTPYSGSFFGFAVSRAGRILAYGMLGNVYYSDDDGDSWHMVQTGTKKSFMGSAVTKEGAIVLVGLDGTLVASNDGGQSFEDYSRREWGNLAGVLQLSDGDWLLFGANGIQRVPLKIR